jgi:hypothetical protein
MRMPTGGILTQNQVGSMAARPTPEQRGYDCRVATGDLAAVQTRRTGHLGLEAIDLVKADVTGLADADVLLVFDDGTAEDGVVAAEDIL